MLTRLELKELASHTLDQANFVSLYLDLDPSRVKRDDWHLHYKNLVKSIPTEARAAVMIDLDRIEQFLGDHPDGVKRGLAVISCSAHDYWWVYHSALGFPSELVVKNDPYITPLVTLLDQYQRYVVVVVGSEDARLFLLGMGDIVEMTEFFRPSVMGDASRDGGWGDMGALRAQRRREHTQRVLFKDVALAMDSLLNREEIKRVLLGGTDSARGRFKEALPEALSHRVVGEFHVEKNVGHKEIVAKLMPVMQAVERRFEKKALEELFHKTSTGQGAVLGLEGVLGALQQGNVRKMFVLEGKPHRGMVCQTCAALTPLSDEPCPYCGGNLKEVAKMLDLALQKATSQGARVDILHESPELAKEGGIGAVLRF